MATTWSPRTALEPKSWLLTNGEVVREPALEETSSGRKVRIAGTSLTAYARDIDDLVLQGVKLVAQQKGTHVWMREGDLARHLTATGHPKLHITHSPGQNYASTDLWWTFRHPTLPIEAVLTLTVHAGHTYSNQPRNQTLTTRLHAPITEPAAQTYPATVVEAAPRFGSLTNQIGADNRTRFREFVRDNPPAWDTDLLGQVQFTSERQAVTNLLKKVRQIDDLTMIQIPDLRDPQNPAWLDLPLYDTNVGGAFITELTDYLEGAPSVAEALHHYQEMMRTLRSVGVVMSERTENDFQAALANGDKEALTINIGPVAEIEHRGDGFHTLTMHLPTGTFIVNCSLHTVDRNTVAEKWEEALTLAQLTGQESELLAFARRYAEDESKRRSKQILDERKNGTAE